jgi:pSer/pThr/pTyr-binding forkhead associated (FHA) protein
MLIRLRIRRSPDGPAEEREFVLDALRVGRAPSADLVIPDDAAQTVSWQHARVDSAPNGPVLHDLKSTNGTYLNGRRVDGSEPLRAGDATRPARGGSVLPVLLFHTQDPRTSKVHS